VLSFLEKNYDSVVPAVKLGEGGGGVGKENASVAARVQKLLTRFVDLLEKVKLRDALRVVLAVSRIGNQHMQAQKPWVLVKGNDQEKLVPFCTM
jgi:methionyl-tRNA synthetase